jgi:hypothetical protein
MTPTQDFTLTPNVIWGGEEIGFVCHGAHGGGFVYLSLYPHSFGLLLLLSHLCLNSFLLMLWTMHMAPLFKCTQCLLSPLCLNFTLFFWCFGICIWSTLQMHPMQCATRTSLNFFWSFCQRISRRDQQILIFCLWQSFFWFSFKTSNPFQFRWKDCQFGVWSVCVCVCVCVCFDVWWELGNRLQILNGLDTISVQCNLIFQIPPPFPSHTHTHTLTLSPSTNCQPLK